MAFLFSIFIVVNLQAQPVIDMYADMDTRSVPQRYADRVKADLLTVGTFKRRLQDGSGCLSKKESRAKCFRKMLASFEITTATQIVTLMLVATWAAVKDREDGVGSPSDLPDLMLAVHEHVDLEKFYLAQFKAKDDGEKYELDKLKSEDEKLLDFSFVKAVPLIEQALRRAPASVSINKRLNILRNRRWRFAD